MFYIVILKMNKKLSPSNAGKSRGRGRTLSRKKTVKDDMLKKKIQ